MIAPNPSARPTPLTKQLFAEAIRPLLPYFVALQARVFRETGNPFEGTYRNLVHVEGIANLAFYYGSNQFLDEEFAAAKGGGLCKISRALLCPTVLFPHPMNASWWIAVKFNAVDDGLMPRPKRSETGRAILAQREFQLPLFAESVDEEQELESLRVVAWVHCGVRLRANEKGIPMISFSHVTDKTLDWSMDEVEVAETIATEQRDAERQTSERRPLWKVVPNPEAK